MTTPTPLPKKPRHHPQSTHARILKLLQKQRSATNRQLNTITFRYGARIHDLRREGYVVDTVREHDGLYRFFYRGHRDDDDPTDK
ncbi:hypothetical protein G6024_01105 [Dietzia maris]|nr:helix-turn-helix domain-containing protein [Dietzia maris]MBB0995720.1 hypothetical protein [Dietzia maris]